MRACLQAVPRAETSALKRVRATQHLFICFAVTPDAPFVVCAKLIRSTFPCRHLSGLEWAHCWQHRSQCCHQLVRPLCALSVSLVRELCTLIIP